MLMCSNYAKKIINFDVKVDETVRYQCRNSDLSKVSDKEIFKIDKSYYFYLYNRNDKVATFSLREISEEEYRLRKEEFFRLRPNGKYGTFQKGGNEYFIGCYRGIHWKKSMPVSDCWLVSPSPLKEVLEAVVSEYEMREFIAKENEAFSRKEYAKKCAALGSKFNVSYVNVLRIGLKEEEIKAFKSSYLEAIEKVKTLPLTELYMLQISLFRNSRVRRRRAMSELGIQFFNANVMFMDLSELESVVNNRLSNYAEQSIQTAIDNALLLSYDERVEIVEALFTAKRSGKREILKRLGVEGDAIDFNVYPLAKIRHAIQSSVGSEQY